MRQQCWSQAHQEGTAEPLPPVMAATSRHFLSAYSTPPPTGTGSLGYKSQQASLCPTGLWAHIGKRVRQVPHMQCDKCHRGRGHRGKGSEEQRWPRCNSTCGRGWSQRIINTNHGNNGGRHSLGASYVLSKHTKPFTCFSANSVMHSLASPCYLPGTV